MFTKLTVPVLFMALGAAFCASPRHHFGGHRRRPLHGHAYPGDRADDVRYLMHTVQIP